MKLNSKQFLNLSGEFAEFKTAAVAILPVPYEGGVTYGTGTARGPDAAINASQHLELYDEMLKVEPFRMGIATLIPLRPPSDLQSLQKAIYRCSKAVIEEDKFMVLLGGDHSISFGYFQALQEKHPQLSIIQLDAHADLRDRYKGNPFSHACVMSRIRELTTHTLQIGIRSMSLDEARRIERESLAVCTMADYRRGNFDIDAAIAHLPEPVYVTVDVDVFDWSVIRSTGTPEPGGFLWDEALHLLQKIFMQKNVAGFDVVELSGDSEDRNSAFAVAKLIYKMLGFKLKAAVQQKMFEWPDRPRGSLF
ncbi:MAG: agmatinase [Desulfobacterales bacterium]|jgi:agmatinase